MTRINRNKFSKRINSMLKLFEPNNEIFEKIGVNQDISVETVDLIDLREQNPETLIWVMGSSFAAMYIIRINRGSLDIWRNTGNNGFRGSLESVFSHYSISKEEVEFEEGIIRKDSRFYMPYFKYDLSKLPEMSVLKPDNWWVDEYRDIKIRKT